MHARTESQLSLETFNELPDFFGRENDAKRLEDAIVKRESRAICGASGMGKTALVLKVMRKLESSPTGQCLYISGFKDLHDLLQRLISALYELRDPDLRRELHTDGVNRTSFENWLKKLPSTRLKGTLFRTVEKGNYRIFLDHPPTLTHAVAKVIKELFWMRNAPVYLLIRDELQQHLFQFYHFFYWGDRERLVLTPLGSEAASNLLDACIERFGISGLDLSDFREEVLELSKHVPGAIVKMCALAADPRYQYGSRIKTKSVYIDYLMSGHGIGIKAPAQATAEGSAEE